MGRGDNGSFGNWGWTLGADDLRGVGKKIGNKDFRIVTDDECGVPIVVTHVL